MRASNVFGPALPGSAVNVTRVVVAKSAPDRRDRRVRPARPMGLSAAGSGLRLVSSAGQAEDAEGGDEFDRDHLAQQRAVSLRGAGSSGGG